MPYMDHTVLDAVERNSSTCVRAVVAAVRGSLNSVDCVLQAEALYPYHRQKVQTLLPTDHIARVRFAR